MNPRSHAILVPLLAVLAVLLGLAETASAAFNPAAQNPHYGNFILQQSEASAGWPLDIADPTKGSGEWIYDSALGVPAYVRQNPWTYFDPLGLRSDHFFSDPGQSREDRDAVRKVISSPPSLQTVSVASDFVPGLGTVKGSVEVVSGVDPITGHKLSGTERVVAGVGTVASILPAGKALTKGLGKLFKIGSNNADLGVDTARGIQKVSQEATEVVANVEKMGSGKSLLPSEGAVGTFDDLINAGTKGDNITPHHIPSANHMAQNGVSKGDGIAINMEQPFPGSGGRHRATFTYGTQADLNLTPRQALGQGISDARRIYQQDGLYGPVVRSSLQDVIRQNRSANPGLFNK